MEDDRDDIYGSSLQNAADAALRCDKLVKDRLMSAEPLNDDDREPPGSPSPSRSSWSARRRWQ